MKLIYSRKHSLDGQAQWWREDSKGYTTDINQAGKYYDDEAEEICAPSPEDSIPIELQDAQNIGRLSAWRSDVENFLRSLPEPRMVRLRKCASRRCGHVYPDNEGLTVNKIQGGTVDICPMCRHILFHRINQYGDRVRASEWVPSPWPKTTKPPTCSQV